MIKFDYNSILSRLLVNLRKKVSWARILPNSVNVRLLEAIAEEEAELARYDEYLTRESKWNLAQNLSSLFHQSSLLGYKPHRHVGAVGFIEVSSKKEAFSNGWFSYLNYKKDDLVRHENKVWKALENSVDSEPTTDNTDWERYRTFHTHNIGIPKYTNFSSESGIPFVSVGAATIEAKDDFITLKVVQGGLRRSTFTAKGDIFEEVIVESSLMDSFYYEIFVNGIKWREVPILREARGNDQVFQTFDSPIFDTVYFRFGDDITGKKLENGDDILINWIETEGATGNLTSQGSLNNVDDSLTDVTGTSIDLYCYNYDSIVGGKNIEDIESIRRNGILSFQAGDRLVSTVDYKVFLETQFDFIEKVVVWGVYETNFDNNNDPWDWVETDENMIFVAGITPGSDPLDFTLNADETDNDNNKVLVIREMLSIKSPTDIVTFKNVEFIHMTVNSTIYVIDENYLLTETNDMVREAIIEDYGVEKMSFKQPIYESNYNTLIDNLEAVRYHTTTFSFYKKFKFADGFIVNGILPLFPLAPSSIKLVAETLDGESIFNVAIDNGSGGWTADSGYTVSGSINYTLGSINTVVEAGLVLDYQQYNVKIYYEPVSNDIFPKERYQILRLDEGEISVSSQYYDGV